MKLQYTFYALIMTLGACAHYPDVRPGETEHKVVVTGESERKAYQEAMSQAKDFCDDVHGGKKPITLSESAEFMGKNEEEYKKARLIKGIAGSLAALGTGAVQETGQTVGSVNLGKPYRATVSFKCK